MELHTFEPHRHETELGVVPSNWMQYGFFRHDPANLEPTSLTEASQKYPDEEVQSLLLHTQSIPIELIVFPLLFSHVTKGYDRHLVLSSLMYVSVQVSHSVWSGWLWYFPLTQTEQIFLSSMYDPASQSSLHLDCEFKSWYHPVGHWEQKIYQQ